MSRRWRAVVGVAWAQLRYDRTRTTLAVLGVVVAVLATTILGGLGIGVLTVGEQKFDQSGRDLWVSGGPARIQPGTVGGFESSLVNAHTVADRISNYSGVATATPLAFQAVYAGRNESDLETVVGVGGPANSNGVTLTAGDGFQFGDRHYANGSYDGPPTNEVVISPRAAELLNASVGEQIHVGATVAGARERQVTVVGISPTYSRFLRTPTVVFHLSELQSMTGTADADRASLLTVRVTDDATVTGVKRRIEAEYPAYDVRTNREQLRAIVDDQSLVIAGGASLVVLAVVGGLALTVNLVLTMVSQQHAELAALKALGASGRTLVGVTVVQALVIGVLGGLVGVVLTLPVAAVLNAVSAAVVGFEGLVQTPTVVLGGGFAIAVGVSLVAALVAGGVVARTSPLRHLPR